MPSPFRMERSPSIRKGRSKGGDPCSQSTVKTPLPFRKNFPSFTSTRKVEEMGEKISWGENRFDAIIPSMQSLISELLFACIFRSSNFLCVCESFSSPISKAFSVSNSHSVSPWRSSVMPNLYKPNTEPAPCAWQRQHTSIRWWRSCHAVVSNYGTCCPKWCFFFFLFSFLSFPVCVFFTPLYDLSGRGEAGFSSPRLSQICTL